MNALIQRKCLCQRNVRSVLSRTSYRSKSRVTADILWRNRERRGVELMGEALIAVTQIRISGNEQLIKTCAVLRARPKAGGAGGSASVAGGAGCPGAAVCYGERVARLHRKNTGQSPTA